MTRAGFDRKQLALTYARRHLKTDPGIQEVIYLPAGAPDREIRLIEINKSIPERVEQPLEPIDFGVDIGGAEGHTLMVLDVTPTQWRRIESHRVQLPQGWSLADALRIPRDRT